MTEINLSRSVLLVLDDETEVKLPAGVQEVEQDIADHWFVKAHFVNAPPPLTTPGTPEYAAARRKEAAAMAEHAAQAAKIAEEAEALARNNEAEAEAIKTEARLAKDAKHALEREKLPTPTHPHAPSRAQLKPR